MSASSSISRSAPVLAGLPAWEEAEDEIYDEGDEGDLGDNEVQEEEDDNTPVSFEEARENLDAMSDWIDFMSRKFSTREADTIFKRLSKLNKFFRPPPESTPAVTLHTAPTIAPAQGGTANPTPPSAPASADTAEASITTSDAPTSTVNTLEAQASESKPEPDEDWFAKWPSASGLIRASVALPLNAQNLIIEYDARLWFHACSDVVRVCPGWVAINVDRCIWGCLDKGWLDYRLSQAGHEGGSDDYMWLKFLRMHRALEVFPSATTETLYGDFEDMLEGGPSFACDFCPGYKDITKKCKICGIEKCNQCATNEHYPLHFRGCEHFNEEEERKREVRRQAAPASQPEEQTLESDDEIESEMPGEQSVEGIDTKEAHDTRTDTKESKNDIKEAKDEKARDSKETKMEEEEEEGDEGDEGTQIDQLD